MQDARARIESISYSQGSNASSVISIEVLIRAAHMHIFIRHDEHRISQSLTARVVWNGDNGEIICCMRSEA